jgi:CBS domain-containing protein
MSPRAACRLASLGFAEVYDYVAGKVDWLARGLPREGEKASEPRAVDIARRDVVTCTPMDRVGELRDRVSASPFGFALVVSTGGVLLGRLRRAALEGEPSALSQAVMEPGPSTVRADALPAALLERLRDRDLRTALVTTPDGELLGVVTRNDLERDRGWCPVAEFNHVAAVASPEGSRRPV